mmetsp:Transcript_92982/g.240710  ORF Transcript_92982/g.240710 Transcript_92982/m.240710 type:complete len:705 (+) Transcript_92982:110-2224(+)
MAPSSSVARPRRTRSMAGALFMVGCLTLLSGWSSPSSLHAPPPSAMVSESSDETSPALSPMGLAAEYITIDVSYMRWMWWPAILYLFWGMAFVCDEYFVRTIDVISDRFQIPDDVAGATLMALGCNGPEMALNTISIFHPSNIGVGAVVGGEVFNVLVIIGTALLATPDMYMPLKLGRFCFFRDVIFYMVSVGMLYWVLHNGSVSRLNAAVLLCGAVIYTLVVTYSAKISAWFSQERKLIRTASRRFTNTRFSFLPRMLSGGLKSSGDDDDSDTDDEPDPETIAEWSRAKACKDPEAGSILGVRVDLRNRLMDRNHHIDNRYMWLQEDALVVSTVIDPVGERKALQLQRGQSGICFDYDKHTNDQHWHHGGLVNQPIFFGSQDGPKDEKSANSLQNPLLTESQRSLATGDVNPPSIQLPGFRDAPWEVIPFEDILYCERGVGDEKHFNLHVHQHDSHLGNLITLELSTKDEAVMNAWVEALRGKLLAQRRKTTEAPPAKGVMDSLMQWVEWLQFPVKFFVQRTIPDMDDPKQQHLYPVSFTMSMVWLAVFAFSVVKACDGIHEDFGISTDVLGFTVAAAGTSFPNVFSGMCVARQGKTSMAVANALGANVQNVFLALAVPWTIQSFFLVGGPFPMPVDNLLPAVLECAITLMPVVLVYMCSSFAMPKWSGGLFLLTYVVYVVFALGQQISKCPMWPFPCGTSSR